jgi:hypothetical protein
MAWIVRCRAPRRHDHDTLMLIDIVNYGWAPVYISNLTEDIPGYIEAPANALAYSWKHFIGGHLGPGHPRRRHAASAVHGGHLGELEKRHRYGRPDFAAADVHTESTTFWVMESIRLDLGYGSQVHL